jgi:spiro-SPASM protein
MKTFNFSVSSVAIFLTDSQKEVLSTLATSSLVELFLSKVKKLFPEIPVFSNHKFESTIDIQFISGNTELEFLFAVTDKLPPSQSNDSDFDEVFFAYFTGISPLVSIELTDILLKRHIRYLAQYSYSENLPKGIVPYFISREFVSSLPDSLPATAHDYLIKNLNNYDAEIFFQEPDLRQYRLDFSLSDPRSFKTTEFFVNTNLNLEYKDLSNSILQNPNGFRLFPSYIEMEIYRGCESSCTFCPRQFISNEKDGTMLSHEFIVKFLKELADTFPYPITICLGGMGEPLLHPELNLILPAILNYPHLKELIIETALYPNLDGFINTINSLGEERKKLSLIVNLTTLNESKYKDIYKNNTNIKTILDKISVISSILDRSNIHVQMIKMKEIEEEIENYFTHFENAGINVILQKYNTYAGLMPEKRVSDLTPIKREFCWHLNRDLYINSDATVSICRQDLNNHVGDLKTDSFFSIWEKGMRSFSESLKGNHDKTNAPCLNCDEWYTFNA